MSRGPPPSPPPPARPGAAGAGCTGARGEGRGASGRGRPPAGRGWCEFENRAQGVGDRVYNNHVQVTGTSSDDGEQTDQSGEARNNE